MANEFIARKGLIALSDSKVTGSLALSGDLSVVGGDIVIGTTSIFSGGNFTYSYKISCITWMIRIPPCVQSLNTCYISQVPL